MGNPHTVIVVDNVMDFPVTYYGRCLKCMRSSLKKLTWNLDRDIEFPRNKNESMGKRRRRDNGMRAQGASAVAVASRLKGLTQRKVLQYISQGGFTY